ncbi:PREDICTED: phorbol-12-myristate-13-acetate-induced protein 1 [Miniopterus natalensis]|uniref:phorbol-12-myristate-13-acetate-induced protein 1 n=1 Tax=Miniopterus natalensis TaxID=291302 RepID=UPI0007A6EAD5|nr:PREDICTED: phorbol-12-myristate-13-acetate-induced protein 1 [Miniopterus natalensis]
MAVRMQEIVYREPRALPSARPSPGSSSPLEVEAECALQLKRIGDRLSFHQKLLNLLSKLYHSGT